MAIYDSFLKWKERVGDISEESSISPRYRSFEGGHYIGFGSGFKYGLIAGIALSGVGAIIISLGLTLLSNPTDSSKGLEKQVQNQVIQVEKSR